MVVEKRKQVPAEIDEAYDATLRKIEAQLDETELFISSKRVKALDDTAAAIQEAHKRIDNFTNETLGKLRTCAMESTKSVEKVQKSLQSILKINSKWQSLEKEKHLSSLSKQLISDLKQEFAELD